MNQATKPAENMSDLIKDDNFLCSMNFEKLGVSLIMLYQGSDKVKYFLFHKLTLIFKGGDYRPSPLFKGIDSIESCVGLLSFLTLQPGDTDKEYFSKYTPAQLDWTLTTACQELKIFVNDFEGDENEYLKAAKKYFKNAYTI